MKLVKTNGQFRFLKPLALLLGVAAFALSAWAQNQATLTPMGQWPGHPLMPSATAVRVTGSYACVAESSGGIPRFLTLDIGTGGPGIKLQKTTSLSAPNWQGVTGAEGISQLALPRTETSAFFRLHKP